MGSEDWHGTNSVCYGHSGIKSYIQDDYVELKANQEVAMDSDFTAFHLLESGL